MLRVRDENGAPLASGSFNLGRPDSFGFMRIEVARGEGRSAPQGPGRYRVQQRGFQLPIVSREVEVRAGEESLVELTLPRAFKKAFVHPRVPADMTWTWLTWRDPAGQVVGQTGGGQTNVDKTMLLHYRLPPGSYTVELSDVLGRTAPPIAFTVEARRHRAPDRARAAEGAGPLSQRGHPTCGAYPADDYDASFPPAARISMRTVRCGTAAIVLLTVPALAQSSIVSPTVSATSEGTSGNLYPWTSGVLRRYQQIHADLGPGAKALKSLAFRLNAGTGSFTRTWPIDCELFMGINQGLGQSSFFFDRNYLLPRTNVVARKVINWGPQGQAVSPGPVPFSSGMTILLDAPFPYVGSPFALVWEAVIYSNAAANTDSGLDADVGTTTIATSAITGTGCVATGRTAAMTHLSSLTDVGGWLGWNFTVQAGPSNASVVLGVGTQNPSLAVPGLCSGLFTDMVAMLPIGSTDAAGALTTQTAGASTFVLKNVAQSGTVYTQAHALDAGQTGIPVASSNGRMTTVPASNLTRVCDVLRVFNDVGGTTAVEGNYFTNVSVNVGYALATQLGY